MILLHHRSDLPTGLTAGRHDDGGQSLLKRSMLYREFLAEREEIHRLKWIESEKAGRDIGLECALVCWVTRHRSLWRKARRRNLTGLN